MPLSLSFPSHSLPSLLRARHRSAQIPPPTPLFKKPTRASSSVAAHYSGYFDPSRPPPQESFGRPPPPPPPRHQKHQGRVFVGYSFYKAKGALTLDPKSPQFVPLDSGAYKVAKEGFVWLQFAPAVANRQYDWSRKQVFSLSVWEIGHLISLGPTDSCEFFHDPLKGRSDEGKIRKVLKVEPLLDGNGHFFNLSVQNSLLNLDESIYIPLTKGEFAIMISTFSYVIPFLMGWSTFASSIRPEEASHAYVRSQSRPELEWRR